MWNLLQHTVCSHFSFLEMAAVQSSFHLWKEVQTACSKIRRVWWVGKYYSVYSSMMSCCYMNNDQCATTLSYTRTQSFCMCMYQDAVEETLLTQTTTSLQCMWMSYSGLYYMAVTLPNLQKYHINFTTYKILHLVLPTDCSPGEDPCQQCDGCACARFRGKYPSWKHSFLYYCMFTVP
jgi:hypothetical protein